MIDAIFSSSHSYPFSRFAPQHDSREDDLDFISRRLLIHDGHLVASGKFISGIMRVMVPGLGGGPVVSVLAF